MFQQVRTDTPGRLERRPEATAYQLDDLVAMVANGQLRLPHFQRRLKWRDSDRVALFDSLYRGFPIGTLLLWKHEAPDDTQTFGDAIIEARRRGDGLFIVDGQQRIATLASALLVQPEPGARAVVFDLEAEEFKYARLPAQSAALPLSDDRGARSEAALVPAYTLFDASRLIEWIVAARSRNRPEHQQRALECGKRLREYRAPAYVVEVDDEDVLRLIFDRINRTGRRLDETDVFTALFAAKATDGGDAYDLSRVVRRVAQRGFGDVQESTVLNALRAVMDLPMDRDFTQALKREAIPEAIERTEAALERTVTFLREVAHMPHQALCPYQLPLVVLARLFDAFPEPSLRNRILLRRWIWRASLAQKLGGASVSLRQHVDAVRSASEDASVQRLLQLDAADAGVGRLGDERFNTGAARTRLAMCALAALEPMDLETGAAVDVPRLFASKASPELPVIVGGARDGLARTIANRLMHPHLPPKRLLEAMQRADGAALASHGILDVDVRLLADGDDGAFLSARHRRLTRIIDDSFEREAEFGGRTTARPWTRSSWRTTSEAPGHDPWSDMRVPRARPWQPDDVPLLAALPRNGRPPGARSCLRGAPDFRVHRQERAEHAPPLLSKLAPRRE